VKRFDPEHAGQFSGATRGAAVSPSRQKATGKKKPDVFTSGWEALLLSHIKAPAQGGKAGSGKPPAGEFNKDETRFQATSPLSLTFKAKN
jgi:hypothetical protein